jgi:hypothetical protein
MVMVMGLSLGCGIQDRVCRRGCRNRGRRASEGSFTRRQSSERDVRKPLCAAPAARRADEATARKAPGGANERLNAASGYRLVSIGMEQMDVFMNECTRVFVDRVRRLGMVK